MMRSTILAALAACVSSAWAQQVPQLGPFSTAGVGFTRTNLTNPTNYLYHRRPETTPPAQFTTGVTGPLYRLDEIFRQMTDPERDLIRIDGLSTGNDYVPITQGRIDPNMSARQAWAVLFFSIADAEPLPGSPMHAMRQLGGVGGDMFSWVAKGSAPLGAFENQVNLEITAETLGIEREAELNAIDVPMALIVQWGGIPDGIIATTAQDVYFSLTAQSAASLATALNNYYQIQNASGATIFQVSLNGQTWGPVKVFKSADEMGLGGALANDPRDDADLDALAVTFDEAIYDWQIIFSTTAATTAPNEAQLRVKQGPAPAVELRDVDGNSLKSRMGGDTDVDAVCGVDPERYRHSPALGTPVSTSPHQFVLSASRVVPLVPLTGGKQYLVLNCNAPNSAELGIGSLALQFRPNEEGPWQSIDEWHWLWDRSGTHRINVRIPKTWGAYEYRMRWTGVVQQVSNPVWVGN